MPKTPRTELSPPEQRRLLREQDRQQHEQLQRQRFLTLLHLEEAHWGPWANREYVPLFRQR